MPEKNGERNNISFYHFLHISDSSGTDLCIAFLGADLPAGTTGVVAIAMCCTVLS